jgi:hypothetical protein
VIAGSTIVGSSRQCDSPNSAVVRIHSTSFAPNCGRRKLNGVLGVFQKMIASKNSDHEGFYMMQNLIVHYRIGKIDETNLLFVVPTFELIEND